MAAISLVQTCCVTLPHFRWRKCPLEPCMDPSGRWRTMAPFRSGDRNLSFLSCIFSYVREPWFFDFLMIPYPPAFDLCVLCFLTLRMPIAIAGLVRYLLALIMIFFPVIQIISNQSNRTESHGLGSRRVQSMKDGNCFTKRLDLSRAE